MPSSSNKTAIRPTEVYKMAVTPQTVELLGPVLDALRALGGSARPREVVDWIAEELQLPNEVVNQELSSGQSRYGKRVHWARFYLAEAGLIDSSKRGVWTLTEKGRLTRLDLFKATALHREIREKWQSSKKTINNEDRKEPPEALEKQDCRSQVLSLLGKLPPDGFERFCQRMLRESGFENVTVTGRSGDGDIDGHGILRVNRFVSYCVYFQCKRCSTPVGPSVVRDIRGAMMGRADKGVILTTTSFTKEARKEAVRDGVPPIELVDGDNLVSMLQELELGLNKRVVFEVDEEFFVEFGHQLEEDT
jgi:restriction system protein